MSIGPSDSDAALCRKEDDMTEIILTFPVRRTGPLSCVWIKTGNPAQPLACRWIPREEPGGNLTPTEVTEPQRHSFCA